MADLMTGTYSTENLRRDNGGFMIPDFSIEADGKQIRRSSKSGTLFIDSVQLKLSADASGSLTFDVLNAYDLEARKFSDKVKEMLKPGNAVSAKFGYAGNLVEIFSGYIHSVNYEYNDTPTISVTAVDMIRLMQDNEGGGRIYTGKSYTEIFQAVMKRYSSICPSKNIKADPPAAVGQTLQIAQKGSDYSFVKDTLCRLECREFFVLAGKAYFIDASRKKQSVVSLEWGRDILSFSCERNYIYETLRVQMVDQNRQTKSLEKETTFEGQHQKRVIPSPGIKNVSIDSEGDAERAVLQVKKAVDEERQKAVHCSGTCIGIPQIVPGRSLTIRKLDAWIDGTYEILSVEHRIDENGYTTQFELGG